MRSDETHTPAPNIKPTGTPTEQPTSPTALHPAAHSHAHPNPHAHAATPSPALHRQLQGMSHTRMTHTRKTHARVTHPMRSVSVALRCGCCRQGGAQRAPIFPHSPGPHTHLPSLGPSPRDSASPWVTSRRGKPVGCGGSSRFRGECSSRFRGRCSSGSGSSGIGQRRWHPHTWR